MENRAYYDEFAAGYEKERLHDGGYHALIDRLEVGLALRHIERTRDRTGRGADVLEAGCGTGLILQKLRPAARRAVGVDLSSGMLRRAAGRGLPVAQGSVTALPFPDESFDVTCSFKVLPHVADITAALSELSRVTRRGGHLIVEFYNPMSLRYLVKRLKPATPIAQATTDEAVFTRYDTLEAVRGYLPAGHEVVDLRGVRVVTPVSTVYQVAPLGRVFRFLEERLCDAPLLRRLGGFLVVVVRRP